MLSVIEFSDDELEVSLKMLILIKTSKRTNNVQLNRRNGMFPAPLITFFNTSAGVETVKSLPEELIQWQWEIQGQLKGLVIR